MDKEKYWAFRGHNAWLAAGLTFHKEKDGVPGMIHAEWTDYDDVHTLPASEYYVVLRDNFLLFHKTPTFT